jgi:hypothetical protein
MAGKIQPPAVMFSGSLLGVPERPSLGREAENGQGITVGVVAARGVEAAEASAELSPGRAALTYPSTVARAGARSKRQSAQPRGASLLGPACDTARARGGEQLQVLVGQGFLEAGTDAVSAIRGGCAPHHRSN